MRRHDSYDVIVNDNRDTIPTKALTSSQEAGSDDDANFVRGFSEDIKGVACLNLYLLQFMEVLDTYAMTQSLAGGRPTWSWHQIRQPHIREYEVSESGVNFTSVRNRYDCNPNS